MPADGLFARNWRGFLLRLSSVALFLVVWFWTQSALGSRLPASGRLGDQLHNLTAPLNAYFAASPRAANALLIFSSALIDAFALFLIGSWLFLARLRPFLGLVLLMATRQAVQALCSLPIPDGMIWRYPGFPSLLVTYGVSSDFFFSGHTAIAVYGAVELARFRGNWLTALAVLIAILEAAIVLVLRAHYTMDVFAGAITALWVASLTRHTSSSSARNPQQNLATAQAVICKSEKNYSPQNDGSGFSSSKPTSHAS